MENRTVLGIGGSPSFCWRESATTKKALRPIDIRSGELMILIGFPTDKRSKTISRMAKSSFSWAINWIILTKMLRGVSLGTTAFEPLGNSWKRYVRINDKSTNSTRDTLSLYVFPYHPYIPGKLRLILLSIINNY